MQTNYLLLQRAAKQLNLNPIVLTPEEKAEKALCERSFYEFVKHAWPYMQAGKYRDGWHIAAFCDHLQTMHMQGIKEPTDAQWEKWPELEDLPMGHLVDLVYNGPFRAGKSNVLAVALAPWIWIDDPTESFFYTSYTSRLTERDSKATARLLKSKWYQKYWGKRVKIETEKVEEIRLVQGGYRIIASVNSGSTGEGANFIIVDDSLAIKDADSNTIRNGTNEWWDEVMPSRYRLLEDRKRIIAGQRAHYFDLSGHVLRKGKKSRWLHLAIPEEFRTAKRCITIPVWNSNGKPWKDPRTKEDELMWPAGRSRADLEYLKEIDFNNDARIIECQLQQNPLPDGGGIIKEEWFCKWDSRDLPNFEYIVTSWDTALTTTPTSNYSAATTWGLFRTEDIRGAPTIGNVMLLSLFKGKLEGEELRQMAKRLFHDYHDISTEKMFERPLIKRTRVDLILVESKASGYDLSHTLLNANLPVMGFNPTQYGNKIKRCKMVTYLMQNGRVWLPTQSPYYEAFTPQAKQFLNACALFPSEEIDEVNDVIDTTSQYLIYMDRGGFLRMDEETPPHIEPDWKNEGNYGQVRFKKERW